MGYSCAMEVRNRFDFVHLFVSSYVRFAYPRTQVDHTVEFPPRFLFGKLKEDLRGRFRSTAS